MLKRDNVIQSIIANGYNEELVKELPKLFIEDYLEKDKETLSEALDIFIDRVQSGELIANEFGNNFFGIIQKMSENDFNPNTCDGLFYNFKFHIKEEYLTIVKRRPLRNILVNAGVLELDDERQRYNQEIVGSPLDWQNLCKINCISIRSHDYKYYTLYIRLEDLYTIFENKGINETEWKISNGDIFINHEAIVFIGKENEYLPKKKPLQD